MSVETGAVLILVVSFFAMIIMRFPIAFAIGLSSAAAADRAADGQGR